VLIPDLKSENKSEVKLFCKSKREKS